MNKVKEEKHKPNFRVFVSYAKEDSVYADELLSYLSTQPKLDVFTTNKISAGEKWRSKIKNALNASDIFLVILSPASVKSSWVLFELGLAWGLDMPIIPVATHPGVISKVPVELNNVQVIDLEKLKNPEAINQIMKRYEKRVA
jgi:TIR domain